MVRRMTSLRKSVLFTVKCIRRHALLDAPQKVRMPDLPQFSTFLKTNLQEPSSVRPIVTQDSNKKFVDNEAFARMLLLRLPSMRTGKVNRLNESIAIVDVDEPMVDVPEIVELPYFKKFDSDYVAFMSQFKESIYEDICAEARRVLVPRGHASHVDLSTLLHGSMKTCTITCLGGKRNASGESDLWAVLTSRVDPRSFGDELSYFTNFLVVVNPPTVLNAQSAPPIFGWAMLKPDLQCPTQGDLVIRLLTGDFQRLTGHNLTDVKNTKWDHSVIRWVYVTGLTPQARKYQSSENPRQPVFHEQISQRKLQPWPAVPENPTEHGHLNALQNRAVSSLSTTSEPGIYYIIGPPGTGKTTLIAELLKERVKHFPTQRILVVTPSNKSLHVLLHSFLSSSTHEEDLPLITLRANGDLVPEDLRRVHVAQQSAQILAPLWEVVNSLETHLPTLRKNFSRAKALVVKRYTRVFDSPVGMTYKYQQCEHALNKAFLNRTARNQTFASVQRVKDQAQYLCKRFGTTIHNLEALFLDKSQIIFSTLSGSGRPWDGLSRKMDCVILDEASQTDYPEALIPMRFSPHLFIQTGDPHQLGYRNNSTEAVRKGYSESMLSRMTQQMQENSGSVGAVGSVSSVGSVGSAEEPCGVEHVLMLTEQYRMHPAIRKWVSDNSYSAQLREAPSISTRESPLSTLPTSMPLAHLPSAFIYVPGEMVMGSGQVSLMNSMEARAIVQMVVYLLQQGIQPEQIGVLTFYTAQVAHIHAWLKKHPLTEREIAGLLVSTVDGCQGAEKDFILLSCVRTSFHAGFLNDERRLNVAMSRAKHARWVFGCEVHLRSSDSDFAEFFDWMDNPARNNVVPVTRVLGWTEVAVSLHPPTPTPTPRLVPESLVESVVITAPSSLKQPFDSVVVGGGETPSISASMVSDGVNEVPLLPTGAVSEKRKKRKKKRKKKALTPEN